jgi:hypothetical protein
MNEDQKLILSVCVLCLLAAALGWAAAWPPRVVRVPTAAPPPVPPGYWAVLAHAEQIIRDAANDAE